MANKYIQFPQSNNIFQYDDTVYTVVPSSVGDSTRHEIKKISNGVVVCSIYNTPLITWDNPPAGLTIPAGMTKIIIP